MVDMKLSYLLISVVRGMAWAETGALVLLAYGLRFW